VRRQRITNPLLFPIPAQELAAKPLMALLTGCCTPLEGAAEDKAAVAGIDAGSLATHAFQRCIATTGLPTGKKIHRTPGWPGDNAARQANGTRNGSAFFYFLQKKHLTFHPPYNNHF
jgi:hypothetical protein